MYFPNKINGKKNYYINEKINKTSRNQMRSSSRLDDPKFPEKEWLI
jgi:hypothetical protein